MTAIPKKTYKTIEWYLYHYREVKEAIEMEKENVILAADYSYGTRMTQNTGTSDKVGNAILKLERLKRKEEWCEVVEETMRKFEDCEIGTILDLAYIKKRKPEEIYDTLYIERSTYYSRKREIVMYAALKACEKGLIKV